MAFGGVEIPIPLGQLGLRTDDPMTSLPPNALIRANNVSLYKGIIEKARGTLKYNTTALGSAVVGVFDWFPTPSLQRLIAVTAGGSVFRDTGGGGFSSNTPIKTGLGALTADTHMLTGGAESAGRNKKLFIYPDAQSQIQVLSGDGSSTANIANPATDWASGNYPTYGILYQNLHIAMGSAADRHRLYCSFEDDHENFLGKALDAFANNEWGLIHWGGSPADETADIQAGVAVDIFTTVNDDGFIVQSDRQFNKVDITVTQASTGSPVYVYEYWNGSSWLPLTLTSTPDYSSVGVKTLAFTIPTDWNIGTGSIANTDPDRYSVRARATTAPSLAVKATLFVVSDSTLAIFPPTFSIYPGEGEGILAAAVYRGLLFIFKRPLGVYVVDGRDPNTANWTISRYSDTFGISSPHGILQVLTDLIAANSFGSYTSLQASDAFGDFEAGDVLANAGIENYIEGQFNNAGLDHSHALYYPAKKQAMFTAASQSTGAYDRMLVLDVAKQSVRPSLVTKDNPNCLGLRRDATNVQRPMYGGVDGNVYFMDQATFNVNGAPFLGEFQTPYIDFSFSSSELGGKNKLFEFLEVNYVPTGNSQFFCDVYIDGQFKQTLSFTQRLGAALDSFVLDVDRLAGEPISSRNRKPLYSCHGMKISFRFYSNVMSEGFGIERILVGFRLSDEQVKAGQT